MRLFKRAPAMHAVLAVVAIASQIALELVPEAGAALSRILAPLVACGMLYAAAAVDAGERVRVRHAWRAFGASAGAIAAIVVSSAATFTVEWFVARALGGVDLLRPTEASSALPGEVVIAVYAAGIAASLPMTFVPLESLFAGRGFAGSFAASARLFAAHAGALAVYGAIALALIAVGLMTMGVGLVVALPLVSCATWSAWRDLAAAPSATPRDA